MLHTRSGRSAVDTRGALDVMVCFKNALFHLHQNYAGDLCCTTSADKYMYISTRRNQVRLY